MSGKNDILIYSAAIVSCVVMTLLLTTSSSISYNITETDARKASVETSQDPYVVPAEMFKQTEEAIEKKEKAMVPEQPEVPVPNQRPANENPADESAFSNAPGTPGASAASGKEDNNEIDRIIIEILLRNNTAKDSLSPPTAKKQDSILGVYPGSTGYSLADAAPVRTEHQGEAGIQKYSVKDGDCLLLIANRLGVTVNDLVGWNKITNPDRIQSGQILIVKSPDSRNLQAPREQAVAEAPVDPEVSLSRPKDFIWPTSSHRISSEYGMRRDPFNLSKIDFHPAIDIIARKGDPVYAVQDAKVVFAGSQGGYGNLVILRHDNGYLTVYAHTWVILVKVGQTVHSGQVIAKVGSTGKSTASHLHFEVRKFTRPVNPMSFLSRYISRNTE